MKKNVVITLCSSDEESDSVKQSKSSSNSVLDRVAEVCSNGTRTKAKYRRVTGKIMGSSIRKNIRSKKDPVVVDLVDCFDKQTEETVNNSSSLGNKLIHEFQSEKEIIEIDAKSQEEDVLVQPLGEEKQKEHRTDNETNKFIGVSVIQNASTLVENMKIETAADFKNDSSKDVTNEGLKETLNFYNEFVTYCGSFEEIPNDRTRLQKKLMKRFGETDSNYLMSQEFRSLIDRYRDKLKKNNLYLIARDLTDELSSRKKLDLPAVRPASKANHSSVEEVCNGETAEDLTKWNKSQRRLIRRVTKKLDKMGKKIRELEEAEVDLSDEEDSAYIQLQRYREKFCQIYRKLCTYKNEVSDAQRVYSRKICFTGSKYPAINKCIENWLNKTKRFPDFTDIVKLLESQSSTLGLSSNKESLRATATEIFQQVGTMLQRRRKYDLWDSVCGFLDETEDPATKDAELEKVLKQNFEARVKKEEEIVRHYAELQEKEKLEPEEVPEDVANNSPVESVSEDDLEVETIEESTRKRVDDAIDDDHLGNSKENDENLQSEKTNEKENNPEGERAKAVKESKNNYKNCKSLKWRCENGAKVPESASTEPEDAAAVEASDPVKDDLSERDDAGSKKRQAESESSAAGKRRRSSQREIFEVDATKENMTQVFDVHHCQILHRLERFDLRETGRVFRDLTNVNRLMKLSGQKRRTSGLFFPGFFRDFEKPAWKKRFQFSYKLVGSRDQKCALNQGEKTGKRVDGGRGDSGKGKRRREVRSNSEGGRAEAVNHSGGSEEDNNENDDNRRNGKRKKDPEESQLDEERDEENEDEEGEKAVEHSGGDLPQKTEKEDVTIIDSNLSEETDGRRGKKVKTEMQATRPESAAEASVKGELELVSDRGNLESEPDSEEGTNSKRATAPRRRPRTKAPPRRSLELECARQRTRRRETSATDEERVKQFLLHSPSSISITPPRNMSFPRCPSQTVLQALATLRGLKDISATIVRGKRRREGEDAAASGGANATPSARNGLPVISNVHTVNTASPKIVTVQGNATEYENACQEPGNQSSIRISNVRGNLPSDFTQTVDDSEAAAAGSSSRGSAPGSGSKRKKTKKTVEYVVLE